MPIDHQDADTYREMLQIALAQAQEAERAYARIVAKCQALQDEIRRYIRNFGP